VVVVVFARNFGSGRALNSFVVLVVFCDTGALEWLLNVFDAAVVVVFSSALALN
jgi:hypothetical protein